MINLAYPYDITVYGATNDAGDFRTIFLLHPSDFTARRVTNGSVLSSGAGAGGGTGGKTGWKGHSL